MHLDKTCDKGYMNNMFVTVRVRRNTSRCRQLLDGVCLSPVSLRRDASLAPAVLFVCYLCACVILASLSQFIFVASSVTVQLFTASPAHHLASLIALDWELARSRSLPHTQARARNREPTQTLSRDFSGFHSLM